MTYTIPLFRSNYDEEEIEAVERTLRSGWVAMGQRTEELEAMFAEMWGVSRAVAVSSGTAALHLALRVLEIGEGDEVIVPSLTFVAAVSCIRYVNAVPVFCDIKSLRDMTLDPDLIERLITPRTKAVVAMHYGGFACDMDSIMDIASRHGVRVIEDAAHALPSDYRGKRLGTIGDAGCFSFFSNKNVRCFFREVLLRAEDFRPKAA